MALLNQCFFSTIVVWHGSCVKKQKSVVPPFTCATMPCYENNNPFFVFLH